MCKKFILSGVSIFLIIYLFVLAYRTLIPIIEDVNDCKIAWIIYNEEFEYADISSTKIDEFDEQAILNCISKYDNKELLIEPSVNMQPTIQEWSFLFILSLGMENQYLSSLVKKIFVMVLMMI